MHYDGSSIEIPRWLAFYELKQRIQVADFLRFGRLYVLLH